MPHPLDKQNMEQIILDSPKQFAAGLAEAAKVKIPERDYAQVVVAGMGGSWMAAALVAEAGLARVPIHIHRTYGLPARLDPSRRDPSRTLVIASSFSGNTEEVLSAYDAAREAGLPLVGTSTKRDSRHTSSKLAQRCEADGVPFVKIPAAPEDMQPRSATGYGVGIVVGLLEQCGLATDEARGNVVALEAFLTGAMQAAREEGERLAGEVGEAVPVIYAPQRYETVARIWKIKFNENAKTAAFWNVFPELNHNEMIGWTRPGGAFRLVLLSDPDAHPRIGRREEVTREMVQPRGVESSMIVMEGSNPCEKIFRALLVGDWASYEVALRLDQDPTPVPMVEEFKKRL